MTKRSKTKEDCFANAWDDYTCLRHLRFVYFGTNLTPKDKKAATKLPPFYLLFLMALFLSVEIEHELIRHGP